MPRLTKFFAPTSRRGRSLLHRRLLGSLFFWGFTAGCALVPGTARADINWDGDNAAGNFSFANNWYGDTVPSASFAAGNLVFNYRNNASQTSQYYDWGSWANINDIIWETTWGANTTLNGNGNGLNFNQRLENRSSFAVTIGSMNLSGAKNGATQIELNPVNGDLTLNGNLYNDNNVAYRTYGGNSKLLTVNTSLGGNSNVSYAIEGYSKVYFTAAQGIGGSSTFDVKTGELWIGTGGSLTNGMRINLGLNDANTAKFYLTGTANDSHNINVLNNGGTKVIGTLGSGGAANTFSGNITNNATSGGVLLENTTNGTANFTGVISGTGSVQIGGGSTAGTVNLAGNNTFSGAIYVSAGTLAITNANSLGRGQIQFGNAGTSLTLLVNSNTAITNQFRVNNAATGGTINVASGTTATISGRLTQDSTKTNSTKFGKDGLGTLVLNSATGDYNGQIQVGNGTVILGTSAALGTNTSTSARGVDLGLYVNDATTSSNVSLLASNGVTVGQSVYVAPNAGNALRTIGLAGAGSAAFSNQFYLDGTLTVNAGANSTDLVTISGGMINTGGLSKIGAGSLVLSGANAYTGQTTVSAGMLVLTNGAALADTAVLQLDNISGAAATVAQSETIGSLRGGGASGGNLSIASGATLTVAEAATQTYAGAIGGSGGLTMSGSGQLNLSGANTYTGATTISSGSLEAQSASALGSTNGSTTVSSGANLKLYGGGSGIAYNAEALTLNGLGPAYGDVGGDAGALRSVGGGNNTWNGNITLNSSSRINSDAAGGAGSLTIAGNITGGNNVLFIGTKSSATANMAISGAISGAGALQDGTSTSLFKDGAATLTLSGNNTYSGDTRISAGNIIVNTGGTLGNGTSDVFIASGASLTLNANSTIASVQEWANNNSGTISIGTGATLTVNGADKGNMFQNSISGAGGLTMAGSGNSTLSLFGAQSYTGTTTVSGGKIATSSALASGNVIVSGGTFEANAADVVANTAAVNISSGTFALGGNDTVASLSMAGGTLSSSNSSTLTAATYALNGGTINVNLGGGAITSSSGTTSLNGTAGATSVALSGGTLNTGGVNRLADNAAVTISAGTLGIGGSDVIGAASLTGGTVSMGTGTILTVTGNSSISGTGRITGGTLAAGNGANLNLANNAGTTTSAMSIGAGSTLSGFGGTTTGVIGGAGLLSPGNSPGILTANQLDLGSGMDFAFEFTTTNAPTYSAPNSSGNDIVHLINGSQPFVGNSSLTSANTVSFYFNDADLASRLSSGAATTYLGGFYIDNVGVGSFTNIANAMTSATKSYYIFDQNGSVTFNGQNYSPLSSGESAKTVFGNLAQTNSAFDTGTVNGTILTVTVVPEPSTYALLGCAAAVFAARYLRKRRAVRGES